MKTNAHETNPDNYIHKNHSVYLLTYHLVFVTKYRKKVITDEIGDFLKKETDRLMESKYEGKLISAETDADHMHLLISLPPDTNLSRIVCSLKTQLSRTIRASEYGDYISKYLWKDSFWSDSYFAATTGSISLETVKSYIEGQRTEAHRRKYVKSGKYKKN